MGSGSTLDGYEAFVWTPSLGMVSLKQFLLDHGVTDVAGSGWARNGRPPIL